MLNGSLEFIVPRMMTQSREKGSALLLLLLSIAVGVSYLMLRSFNSRAYQQRREDVTTQALAAAKRGLLDFAMLYHDRTDKLSASGSPASLHDDETAGPGYLPCPDLDGDGEVKVNPDINGCDGTTVGRLPWVTLGLAPLRDGAGERLWYAVSKSHRGIGSKLKPMNSDTAAMFSVNQKPDIVAIVFAPGDPVATAGGVQTRSAAAGGVENYLEDTNADGDSSFQNAPVGATAFNDRLVSISRQELAQAMEQRVLAEVRARLLRYRDSLQGVVSGSPPKFPVLSRLWDRKASALRLGVNHTTVKDAAAASSGSTLVDDAPDFVSAGVVPGSVVFNMTDGSFGHVIPPVTAHRLQVDGWFGGFQNAIKEHDVYEVYAIPRFSGQVVSIAASHDVTLPIDADELNVQAGDIVANLDTGRQFSIDKVARQQITLAGPADASSFTAGTNFRIRSRGGVAESDSVGELLDTSTLLPFNAPSGTPLLVQNLTKQTFAYVQASASPHLLTLSPPGGGGFEANDRYVLSPFMDTPDVSTVSGWLPVHEIGEPFPTGLILQWEKTGLTLTSSTASAKQVDGWTGFLLEPGTHSLNVPDPERRSMCVWLASHVADCSVWMTDYYRGTVTSVSGNIVSDSAAVFAQTGAQQGDVLRLEDGTDTKTVIKSIQPAGLEIYGLSGPTTTLTPGTTYRLLVATQKQGPFKAVAGTANSDLTVNPAELTLIPEVGAAVVIKRAGGGEAAAIVEAVLTPVSVRLAWSGPPLSPPLLPGDDYVIQQDFIEQRMVEVRLQGRATMQRGSDGTRRRDVDTVLANRQTAPVFVVKDFGKGGKPLGTVEAKLDGTGSAEVHVRGIHSHLAPISGVTTAAAGLTDTEADFIRWGVKEGDWVVKPGTFKAWRVSGVTKQVLTLVGDSNSVGTGVPYQVYADLPPWFVANKWHHHIYVAEAPSMRVGSGSGTVLTVNGMKPDNVAKVIAIATGSPLTTPGVSTQDRTRPELDNFLEGANADGDSVFTAARNQRATNDHLLIVE